MKWRATDVYEKALESEKAAWKAVSEAPPGTPAFDKAKWKAWQTALRLADAARSMMLTETARPPGQCESRGSSEDAP